jgi:hypothetical protein
VNTVMKLQLLYKSLLHGGSSLIFMKILYRDRLHECVLD